MLTLHAVASFAAPDDIYVTAGSMDLGMHPGHPPERETHIFVKDKCPWKHIGADGLPQFLELETRPPLKGSVKAGEDQSADMLTAASMQATAAAAAAAATAAASYQADRASVWTPPPATAVVVTCPMDPMDAPLLALWHNRKPATDSQPIRQRYRHNGPCF